MSVKVVQISGASFGPGGVGGGERYFTEFVAALRERADVDVTTCIVTRAGDVAIDGHQLPRRWSPLALRRLGRAADVVHAHQVNTVAFDVAVAMTRVGEARLAATDHGAGQLTLLRALGPLRRWFVDIGLPVSEWSGADSRLASAPVTATLFGGGDHVLTRPRGTRSFPPTDFLFLGRLMPHKGVHRLIHALPEGRSLRVAGSPGPAAYVDELRRLAQEREVYFELSPGDEDLMALFSSTAFTVLPSTFRAFGSSWRRPELLGLVLLESMACGVPCLGSTAGGLPEVLVRAGMPMFADGHAAGLHRLLGRLPSPGHADYAKMAERVRAAAPFFSWGAAAERAVSAYGAPVDQSMRVVA